MHLKLVCTQNCGWGEPPTPPSLPSFSPGSLTQTFCGLSPFFSPTLLAAGSCVACSDCSCRIQAPVCSQQSAAVSPPVTGARAEALLASCSREPRAAAGLSAGNTTPVLFMQHKEGIS